MRKKRVWKGDGKRGLGNGMRKKRIRKWDWKWDEKKKKKKKGGGGSKGDGWTCEMVNALRKWQILTQKFAH